MNSNHTLLKLLCLTLFGTSILLMEIIGFLRRDYNPLSQYISEMGVVGAQYANIINYFGFLPISICALIMALSLQAKLSTNISSRSGFLLVGLGIFIGYFGAFMFPCDDGCPTQGSFSQTMHNALGLISYMIIPAGLLILGIGLRKGATTLSPLMPVVMAFVYMLGFFMMLSPSQIDLLGFWQRLADYTLILFLIFVTLFAKVEQNDEGEGQEFNSL